MENWIIYYDSNYDAVPWPFAKSWEEFVKSPEPLVHPCDDFGRAAPCDGLSETPSVPPHLPRLVPRGKYRMAIYHDAEWLYVFIEAEDGPVIVSSEQLDSIPHMKGVKSLHPGVVLLTPDQRFVYRFGRDGASVASLIYGKRKVEPPKRELRFDFQLTGKLVGFRIARADVADAFLGNTVRMSMSRMNFETIEAVAWGSHTNWGPRPDEFGTVRLVEQRERPLWPVARRVEMLYEPATEQARLRVRWEGRYEPAETEVQVYPNKQGVVPWLQWSARVNGVQRMVDGEETPAFPLVDGHNHIDIANTGGPAVRLVVEKWSGNRIACFGVQQQLAGAFSEPPAKRQQATALQIRSCDWLRQQVRAEAEDALKVSAEEAAEGAARQYRGWQCYQAASIGRIYHYLEPDPRYLELLRREADFALTLQRDDGSFSGWQMSRISGRKGTPWAGGAFDTGQAGELWTVAAWLLQDEKYLAASQRLLRAYKDYRVEFNYNFAAFTLYHLVTLYRLTREPLALEQALYYAKNCVAVDLLPLGFQAGHNYYSCYGSITLRGMAQLCAVLPEGDPYRATLRELCLRMTNQVLARQQPDGSFDGCDRFFLDERWWSWGLFSVPFLLPPDDVARLDVAIQRLLHFEGVSKAPGGPPLLAESDLVRYYAHRDALLAGKKIDLMSLI